MIFEAKQIILKDGRTAILKTPCIEDAEKIIKLISDTKTPQGIVAVCRMENEFKKFSPVMLFAFSSTSVKSVA